MNLPRPLRYKLEYTIFVGIIPGPNEPKGTLNIYLGPMVKELLDLWSGCWLGTGHNKNYVRAALLCHVMLLEWSGMVLLKAVHAV